MATIIFSLSSKTNKVTSEHEILVRFFHGRINQRAKTGIFVCSQNWSDEKQTIVLPKTKLFTEENKRLKSALQEKKIKLEKVSQKIMDSFNELDPTNVAKDWLKNLIHDFNFPKTVEENNKTTVIEVLDEFITISKFSDVRKRNYKVLWRTLKRFELYTGTTLLLDEVSDEDLRQFESFLQNEYSLSKRDDYRLVLDVVPESRTPQQRGKNTINTTMKFLRTFFKWANDNDRTANNPFKKYKVEECTYGTPFYITIEERNKLYNANFSRHPRLARQRDIFVFQCVVGCRVSDLWAMTKDNVIDGFLQYVPRKTKEGKPVTVRVPLNSVAKEILNRYKDYEGDSLFPFTSQQHYNKDIKTMLFGARINRVVTVLNPTTGESEQRPIYEVASSHMARRCFIGNLYKKVQDPNLIGELSGHVEGSKAFARYREIDDELKQKTVALLD